MSDIPPLPTTPREGETYRQMAERIISEHEAELEGWGHRQREDDRYCLACAWSRAIIDATDALAAENAALRAYAIREGDEYMHCFLCIAAWPKGTEPKHAPECPIAVPPSAHVARFQAAERVAAEFDREGPKDMQKLAGLLAEWRALREGDGTR